MVTMSSRTDYIEQLIERIPDLAVCREQIEDACDLLINTFMPRRNKMLVCGNGGSAADSEHWAGELLKGFVQPRPLTPDDQNHLGEPYNDTLQEGLPVVPLTGFTALQSAFANDVRADMIFAQLTWALGMPDDLLAGFTTSGNSANVCHAFRVARARNMKTLAFTGQKGGQAASLTDVVVRVPAQETHLVQEYHLPVYHTLALALEAELFPA